MSVMYVGCENKGVFVVQENELCVRGGTQQDHVRLTFFAESVNKSAGKCMAVYGTRMVVFGWLCS